MFICSKDFHAEFGKSIRYKEKENAYDNVNRKEYQEVWTNLKNSWMLLRSLMIEVVFVSEWVVWNDCGSTENGGFQETECSVNNKKSGVK